MRAGPPRAPPTCPAAPLLSRAEAAPPRATGRRPQGAFPAQSAPRQVGEGLTQPGARGWKPKFFPARGCLLVPPALGDPPRRR